MSETVGSMALGEYRKAIETIAQGVLKAWPLVRRDFPWRYSRDPWRILLAEILLIQTRAEMVVEVYNHLVTLFPTPCSLASANTEQLEELLRPLGLYRQRARRLLGMARYLKEVHGCEVPCNYETLIRIPGVGEYIAAAVYVVACGDSAPLLDANIARVLSRAVLGTEPPRRYMADSVLRGLAASLRWDERLLYAFIDLASAFCKPKAPRCNECPLGPYCNYNQRRRPARSNA